ncbi:hypothetical protein D5086_028833 [Populus alba]|uniref:Uncharacterized protein n=1 Tax=Populus alba TaxID=43335 RepID=A0ACC4ARU2_POPAL
MEEEEEEEEEFQQGHQSPVLSLITSDDGQDSSQEEYLEGLEGLEDPIPRLLAMSLDAWKDPSTFQDWLSFGSQPDLTETTLVGSFTTTIVGHSGAKFNEHELLEFVRYQQCPSDKNAIKVLNSSSREVGYLCTSVAMVLSPLVDILKINLEGEVICSRFKYDKSIPCVVTIFAESAAAQNAKDWILQHGLRLCDQPGTSLRSYEGTGVQEKGRIEKLGSLEPPNNVIKAKLLDHQKEGLWWLVNKEKSDELPPFWEVKDGSYLNVLTRHQTDRMSRPKSRIRDRQRRSGKTLTLLSLIAFDKVGNVTEGTGEENRVVHVSSGKKRKGGGMVSEKGAHSKGSLKLYKYYGDSRTKDVEELKKYDIVLTTYSTLVAEGCEPTRCPLMKIEWWRVILDEAHVIRKQMQSRFEILIHSPQNATGNECFRNHLLMEMRKGSPGCRSLLPSDNIGDASKHPELLRKMIDGLQDGEDIVCSVCLDPPTDATNHNL